MSENIDIDTIRRQFPALQVTDNGVPRAYFDNPAGTQVPATVAERMSDCLLNANANAGGFFRTSELADEVISRARRAMADFTNAPSPDEIIFGQNMTGITFHLARSIGRHFNAGDEIIVSQMDHDANIQPWILMARDHGLTVRELPFDIESYEFNLEELDRLLGDRTKLVCVGGASNLTGTINDIDAICARARDTGAWSYIDAVQSAPHVPTDVQKIGCDFLVCSAYKFFGPHQGILWGRRAILEQLEPYRLRPAPSELPWCFEPGTQSHEGMAGTAAAVDYFAWIGETMGGADSAASDRTSRVHSGMRCLLAHEEQLATRILAGVHAIPGIRVHGITADEARDRRLSTVAFTSDARTPDAIAKALAARNIFVWSGHNYALEVVKALNLLESGGVVRIGAVHYNTVEEIDRLLNAIEDIVAE